MVTRRALLLLLLAALGGCDERAEGLRATEPTGGPIVVWDVEALPLPEIPLPNDQATRLDPTSPTGRRLNVSLRASTAYERETRAVFDTYDGFGTYAPIFVAFDRPLDLRAIERRFADDDFRDDPFYLLNVDPSCGRFGEEVALDMGRGRFPLVLFQRGEIIPDPEAPDGYLVGGGNLLFPLDPNGTRNNLVFTETDEDRDGDGALDPLEDLDFDGVLDRPNFIDPDACADLPMGTPAYDACVADNLLTWYERETDTLVLRPLWPLEQRCTYAVVLTDRLTGVDGAPVQSPFLGINPRDQTRALAPVGALLERYGLAVENVQFAWTFTTGSMTHDLEALRRGLYGDGPFARLASEFPVDGVDLWRRADLGAEGEGAVLPGGCAGMSLSALWRLRGEWEPNRCAIEADMASIAGAFGGTFAAPDLLVDKQGLATPRYPSTQDERWAIDAARGEATYGRTDVTFWCVLPHEKTTDCAPGNPDGVPFCKPFPTLLYGHGYGGSRIEPITSHVGRTTAMGYAMCALDAYGHGLDVLAQALDGTLTDVEVEDADLFRLAGLTFTRFQVPDLPQLLLRGRDRDLNNDGVHDSGADMWTADLFHTRDMVRQTALEHIQFVRLLRSEASPLRDPDGDGTPDIGGARANVSMWGISLGGIITGVMAGAEPALTAASPNAGGAGLVDVAVRSGQRGVPDAVLLPMMGQLIGGCLGTDAHQRPVAPGEMSVGDCLRPPGLEGDPSPGGVLKLVLFGQDNARARMLPFARIEGVAVGDRVRLRNRVNGEEAWAFVNARGQFRTGVASDALDAIGRRPVLGLSDDVVTPVVVDDPRRLADALEVTIFEGQTERVKATVDAFEIEVTHQGVTYPVGAPLVALHEGLGFQRNTPEFRRFVGLAQHGIGPADPAVWAARTFLEPADVSYDPNATPGGPRVLHMATAGDNNVPVDTGIGMGRAAGVLGSWLRDPARPAEEGWRALFAVDPRYGTSVDQFLVDARVYEGVGRLQRYADNPINPNVLFDADDPSDGAAMWSCGDSDWSARGRESGCPPEVQGQEVFFGAPHPPAGEAVRQDLQRPDGTHDSLRVPVLRPYGQHGIYNAQPFRVFDTDAYMVNFTTRFLGTAGRVVDHEAGCDCSASVLPTLKLGETTVNTALSRACTPDDLKLCAATCGWGIETPAESTCP